MKTNPAAVAFRAALEKKSADDVSYISADLEELYFDDDEPLRLSDMPSAIPIERRRLLVQMAKDKRRIRDKMEAIIEEFHEIATAVEERKRHEAQSKLPHCDACGQLVQSKPKKRK